MTYSNPQVEPDDAAAVAAYEEAWREFTIELNRLHIAYGAASYATLVKASDRPRLTKAGLNEVLSGKRFPSLEALLEFVRVVSTPQPPLPDTPAASGARPELVDQWRGRWQHVKFLQRQAHAPWARVRATVQDMVDQALREAEEVRATTHEEAALIRASAKVDAERLRTQAQHDADELLQRAQAEAERLQLRALQDAEELPVPARADTDRTSSRWGAGLLPPRQAWRPLFAAAGVGVAGMGLAITLAADSLTGQLSNSCRPTRAHSVAPLPPRATLQPGGTTAQAAVAHEPQMIITSRPFYWPSPTWAEDPSPTWSTDDSATPSEDSSSTASGSSTRSASATPTPSGTQAPAGACGRTAPSASPTRSPSSSAS
ncbi:ATP synthase F0 subunit B [Streptomyces sp. NPDC019443]|uniref:ATP synthase F0 subunit B n=1 Tax=Streptomyces sp. NPDC019443 TaxID=3365061 RepID=UPI0037988A85